MTCGIRIIGLAFALQLFADGCTGRSSFSNYDLNDSGHRLVRVSFKGQKGSFKIRVNAGPVQRLANSSFTNVMTAFRFQYGDIVVWEAVRDEHGREISEPHGVSSWWFAYIGTTRAAFYSINSDCIKDFLRTPLYHWTGPDKTPRPLATAAFYKDGGSIGQGQPGLRTVVGLAQADPKPGTCFLLSPQFTTDPRDQPWPAMEQLDRWLAEAGVKESYLYAEENDFARMMKEP